MKQDNYKHAIDSYKATLDYQDELIGDFVEGIDLPGKTLDELLDVINEALVMGLTRNVSEIDFLTKMQQARMLIAEAYYLLIPEIREHNQGVGVSADMCSETSSGPCTLSEASETDNNEGATTTTTTINDEN